MEMKRETVIRLVRSATFRLSYAGKAILVDPMLSPRGAIRSFAGKERNPIVDLSMSVDEITRGLDAVLVTHAHPDHFDQAAMDALPKGLPLFIQPRDAKAATGAGFTEARIVRSSLEWDGISITRTGGKHGVGPISIAMGKVSGYVLSSPGWPTIYIIGDSVLVPAVRKAIERFKPDIIVVNSGGAMIRGSNRILMDAAETVQLAKLAPRARIVAVHMEALDHCTVTRAALREAADSGGVGDRVFIPRDGETIRL